MLLEWIAVVVVLRDVQERGVEDPIAGVRPFTLVAELDVSIVPRT